MEVYSSTRLLILDDEQVIVDTLCAIVKQFGFESHGAYTHDSAIAIAREFRPNVFLAGFNNLCDKNGCQTAIEILAFSPECRVIIFSGYDRREALNDYRRRGYEFELVPKPFDPKDLLRKLHCART